ncbi:hypothetical protein CPB83DRAFT_842145 [Crepidotus variabilis]|uniref:Peptide-O-fucosyltransferase n=1 Tax=Crepidotus variabilis TaxID=179855 RepID=A0A9P6JVP6_9AGAR|nr:hypothetical protein CPB83DRAFT_842145 [Crepidotus variabilis]
MIPRTRSFYTICISLVGLSVLGILSSSLWTLRPSNHRLIQEEQSVVQHPLEGDDLFGPQYVLRGPPTQRFRDNLRPDVQYVSSWISAGWTNDVMTYINLIYLAVLTNRVPIVGMFVPTHVGGSTPTVDFGEVFDVPRLRKTLGRPIVEWHEVKDRNSTVSEDIGCWSVWQAVQNREEAPRSSVVPGYLKLDISYTKAPTWINVIPGYEHDQHSSFSSLATLGFPDIRKDHLVEPRESPTHMKLPPDEQILCYDYLYYVCSNQPFEFDFDYSPAWLFVGQHMHWAPKLQALADDYIRATFQINDPSVQTPPYIGIHIRHGDFSNYCGDIPLEDCFAPISVIARRVEEVKKELMQKKGIAVEHVIMTSDERKEEWWEQVRQQGWYQVDHSQTVERYGRWYPVFIDAVIQSDGIGFVGTDRSTMSMLARRRVLSWRGGAVRVFRWGRPGADDH